jgi:Domain of unknown function (DUF4826)
MNDDEFTAWNNSKRAEVISYLQNQGILSPEVGAWPAFEAAPHFGIWCVESKKQKGKIGWWAFAGDCPTDYVSEDGRCHPRAALENLLRRWKEHIPHMKNGLQPPDVKFGDGSNIKELGDLLERRVTILEKWLTDDDLWEDR